MNDLWRALRYLRKYWGTTLGAFLSLLIVTATNLFSPQLLRLVIDQGISAQNLSVILLTSLGLLGVAIVRDSFTFTQSYWSERASQGAAYDMRNAIFTRLEHLSFSYHDKAQTGQLMTRVTNDVETVRAFTGNGILQLLNAVVMLIGSATILLLTNWEPALVAQLIRPGILGIFLFFVTKIGPRFRIVQQRLGNLNTVLQENLAGVRVVKAFVREAYEQERYRNANTSLLQENLAVVRGTALTFPLIFFISNLGTLAVIWLGGEQVIGGSLSIGELVAFTSYLRFLLLPVFILGSTITSLSQSAASAHRIFEIIDAPIEVKDKPDAVILPPTQGSVIFEDVSFRYAGSETLSLTDVSFVAEPGQTVAILGRTGSGKSTIINLIPRFYDVTSGSVSIDGYDVRDVTLESLRSQIGIVLQESTLFSGTIRENIAYGRSNASEEEVEEAAKAAQAHDFIIGFPDGYTTIVGERGVGLSGGQRQRIALARALLLNPPLLILDDSTSAVDAETEYQIQQALPPVVGRVVFDHVNFAYNADDEKPDFVLHDINLTVEPGQTIAFVGETGAGKSTLISLIPRFYDVTSGKVTIDGYNVHDVTLASLRKQIGLVQQDTYLFSGSVADNLRYGRLDATDEEVEAAAKTASAHDFIMTLPQGYKTILGERGSGLSQGQRQLLAFARTVLASTRILILDEATSSIDTRTEELIQEALKRLLKGRTSFVIAHRLSTIRDATTVIVIDKGQIAESGTHVNS